MLREFCKEEKQAILNNLIARSDEKGDHRLLTNYWDKVREVAKRMRIQGISERMSPAQWYYSIINEETDGDYDHRLFQLEHYCSEPLCYIHWRLRSIFRKGDSIDYSCLTDGDYIAAEEMLRTGSQRDPSGCLLWMGAQTDEGYGQANLFGRTFFAHRLSYQIFHMKTVEEELEVRHSATCISRTCIDPTHLQPGTHKQNMDDKIEKGTLLYGEKNPAHRYSDEQFEKVKALLEEDKKTQAEIARETKVTRRYVSIVNKYGARSAPRSSKKKLRKISERPKAEVQAAAEEAKKRLDEKVEIQANGCWNWLGGGHKSGYGQASFLGETFHAHSFSWMIYHNKGQRLKKNQVVRHICKKNRKCVNPNHLIVGTRPKNGKDAGAQGSMPKGEKHHRHIFSDDLRAELTAKLLTTPLIDVFREYEKKELDTPISYKQLKGLKNAAKKNVKKEKETAAHKRKLDELFASGTLSLSSKDACS